MGVKQRAVSKHFTSFPTIRPSGPIFLNWKAEHHVNNIKSRSVHTDGTRNASSGDWLCSVMFKNVLNLALSRLVILD